jgi:hypothetical protein
LFYKNKTYMKPVKKKDVKMKNLIGIIDDPTHEDLLFEIVQFLDNSKRYDGEFKMREVSMYTRVRIGNELQEDIDKLIEMGYLEKLKYTSYKVLKHLWE